MKEEKSFISCHCPRCFKNWQEEGPLEIEEVLVKACEFCSQPNKSSLDILHRMIEVMDTAHLIDYPKFIKHLLKHLVLKE